MRLEIGNRVRCNDGLYGELADVVIDPLEKRVTHLVVLPEQAGYTAGAYAAGQERDDKQREIELGCTLDDAQQFESVLEAAYIRLGENPALDTPTGTSASWRFWQARTTPVSA